MKWLKKYRLLKIISITTIPWLFKSWGFSAHKVLHAVAITILPQDIFPFFKHNEPELINYSDTADRRKHTVPEEAKKHYLDLDSTGGVLPKAISDTYRQLVFAMDNCSSKHIVKVAADLGHYIGDALVPLHTTYNYNGQFSGQTGIHSLWETHVYELTIDQRISRRLEV